MAQLIHFEAQEVNGSEEKSRKTRKPRHELSNSKKDEVFWYVKATREGKVEKTIALEKWFQEEAQFPGQYVLRWPASKHQEMQKKGASPGDDWQTWRVLKIKAKGTKAECMHHKSSEEDVDPVQRDEKLSQVKKPSAPACLAQPQIEDLSDSDDEPVKKKFKFGFKGISSDDEEEGEDENEEDEEEETTNALSKQPSPPKLTDMRNKSLPSGTRLMNDSFGSLTGDVGSDGVAKILVELAKVRQQNAEILAGMEILRNQISDLKSGAGRVDTAIADLPMEPVKADNLPEVGNLEESLDDRATFKAFYKAMLALKGRNVCETVKNLVHFLLSNRGMLLFTWGGTAEKKAFKETKMYRLVMCAAMKMHPIPQGGVPRGDSVETSNYGTQDAVTHPMKTILFKFASRRTKSMDKRAAKENVPFADITAAEQQYLDEPDVEQQ